MQNGPDFLAPLRKNHRMLVALVGLLLFALPLKAEANLCDYYAKTALEQQKRAGILKCGFTENGWKAPASAHIGWCKQVRHHQVHAEIKKRHDRIKLCAALYWARESGAICTKFAAQALQQTNAVSCLFQVGRWSRDRNTHRNWCLELFKSAIMNNLTNSPNYLTKAMKDAHKTLKWETDARRQQKGCTFSGGRR